MVSLSLPKNKDFGRWLEGTHYQPWKRKEKRKRKMTHQQVNTMTPRLIYMLKVNVGIALFYAFYHKLFCGSDTFFKWRQIALLQKLTLSFLYPLLNNTDMDKEQYHHIWTDRLLYTFNHQQHKSTNNGNSNHRSLLLYSHASWPCLHGVYFIR